MLCDDMYAAVQSSCRGSYVRTYCIAPSELDFWRILVFELRTRTALTGKISTAAY